MSKPRLTWQYAVDPRDDDITALRHELRGYNMAHRVAHDRETLAWFIHDAAGALVGGIVGERWGAVLEIDFLWLAEDLRGQGIGHELLTRMEQAGYAHGARLATLDSFSFQAPQFYRDHGYEPFGEIEGYPDGHRRLFFRKVLCGR